MTEDEHVDQCRGYGDRRDGEDHSESAGSLGNRDEIAAVAKEIRAVAASRDKPSG